MKRIKYIVLSLIIIMGLQNPLSAQRKDCITKILPRRADSGVSLTARTRGVSPFKYRWSTGETTQSIVVGKPGKYCVKVEDAEGCMSDACFELREKPDHDGKCRTKIQPKRTGTDKEVELVARSTGKAPFKYRWSTGETTQSIVVNKPGKYCVKVEDAEGCMSDACFELREKPDHDGKCRTKIQPKRTGTDKEVELVARSTGKAPFKYRWSTGETTQSIVVGKPGKYCVKVEDAEGCMSDACFVLRKKRDKRKKHLEGTIQPRANENQENAYIRDIIVYPNPIQDVVHIEMQASEGLPVQVEIMDMQGKVYQKVNLQGQSGYTQVEVPVQDIKSGQYIIRVISDEIVQTIRVMKI